MSDSDEDRLLLEDESMDEMHEIEDALQVSIDTNASSSPVKRNGHHKDERDRDASDSDSDDDDIDPFRGPRDDSDDDDDDSDASSSVEIPSKMAAIGFHDIDAAGDAEDSGDEPPEIPGSPMAAQQQQGIRASMNQSAAGSGGRMNRLSEVDIANCGESSRQPARIQDASGGDSVVNVLRLHRSRDSNSSSSDDDEYVVKESEQPRCAEFHASSSSESENESDSEGDENNGSHGKRRAQQASYGNRPKTAAKDLECYRDVVPSEFFQQRGETDETSETLSATSKNEKSSKQQATRSRQASSNNSSTDRSADPSTTAMAAPAGRHQSPNYVLPVPQEVESLFQLIDAYTPDAIEIETRLEPFVPDYIPTIGLPFDGIQIPRPDGKIETEVGLQVLKEPSSSSNVAELELLMETHLKNQQRAQRKTPFVHSIEDAEHRPKDIHQWIESVAKVQSSKPLAQVVYKKPMPTLESLMELWPEEMEIFLSQNPASTSSLSKLDVNLDEFVKIVCVLLDIPVYEGGSVQSLHVLFSLFHEIECYERDMEQQQQQQQQRKREPSIR